MSQIIIGVRFECTILSCHTFLDDHPEEIVRQFVGNRIIPLHYAKDVLDLTLRMGSINFLGLLWAEFFFKHIFRFPPLLFFFGPRTLFKGGVGDKTIIPRFFSPHFVLFYPPLQLSPISHTAFLVWIFLGVGIFRWEKRYIYFFFILHYNYPPFFKKKKLAIFFILSAILQLSPTTIIPPPPPL